MTATEPVQGRFSGKIVMVTGGASGIGAATASLFARHGASVVVVDKDAELGRRLTAALAAEGAKAAFVEADLATTQGSAQAVADAIASFGRIDYAVNNAGIADPSNGFLAASAADWEQVNAINLRSVWACMQAQISHMLANGRGAIVNVSSRTGLVGKPKVAMYAATKHGVLGLTKSAAIEFAGQGIRINAICPGFVRTPFVEKKYAGQLAQLEISMNPMGRAGRPEEIAQGAAWLCSDEASFITGIALPIDGGAAA